VVLPEVEYAINNSVSKVTGYSEENLLIILKNI